MSDGLLRAIPPTASGPASSNSMEVGSANWFDQSIHAVCVNQAWWSEKRMLQERVELESAILDYGKLYGVAFCGNCERQYGLWSWVTG